jgi:hypothetical protein
MTDVAADLLVPLTVAETFIMPPLKTPMTHGLML